MLGVVLFGVAYATTLQSVDEITDSRDGLGEVRAQYVAEAGFQRSVHYLNQAAKKNPWAPIEGITALFGANSTLTPYLGEALFAENAQIGAYSVTLTKTAETPTSVTVQIDTTGYLPAAPGDLAPGQRPDAWKGLSVTVQYSTKASGVFDYGYFINNWGWFYGNTIYCNGNARSNGQFDSAGYSPTVTGQPIYDEIAWNGSNAELVGYHDDNEDGLEDGKDGGIFSGWDIINTHNVQGQGGDPANQHDFQEAIEMPNLSNLSMYEKQATAAGGKISIGGTVMSNSVYGDEPGEAANLYLIGTAAQPVVLDGMIVVQGNVLISGVVTGQGTIYAGGNVYVPDGIEYLNPPSSTLPAGTSKTQTEAWLTANKDKDLLGLFAKESVVAGDFTNSSWQHYISYWMGSSMNKSEEDAGEDGIPNTAAGKDGIAGTADDDVLEDDGNFTIEYYSEKDELLGIIPAGYTVGDPIPGTGEDIDGDGVYDPTTTLADMTNIPPLDSSNWGGNLPSGGVANYSDISSVYATKLDAIFYTNHSFCYLVLGGINAEINGAVVSRNENIVYGTPKIAINYDCRLLGGSTGIAGDMLPQVLGDPIILRWVDLDADPHLYATAAVQP